MTERTHLSDRALMLNDIEKRAVDGIKSGASPVADVFYLLGLVSVLTLENEAMRQTSQSFSSTDSAGKDDFAAQSIERYGPCTCPLYNGHDRGVDMACVHHGVIYKNLAERIEDLQDECSVLHSKLNPGDSKPLEQVKRELGLSADDVGTDDSLPGEIIPAEEVKRIMQDAMPRGPIPGGIITPPVPHHTHPDADLYQRGWDAGFAHAQAIAPEPASDSASSAVDSSLLTAVAEAADEYVSEFDKEDEGGQERRWDALIAALEAWRPFGTDWRCECGDLNRAHESTCYRCGGGAPDPMPADSQECEHAVIDNTGDGMHCARCGASYPKASSEHGGSS